MLWLFENVNFAERAPSRSRPNSPICFGIRLIKISLIGSIVSVFENHEQVLHIYTVTPPYCTYTVHNGEKVTTAAEINCWRSERHQGFSGI